MTDMIKKGIPEFSVTGIVGTYLAYVAASGHEAPVDPFWVVVGLTVVFFAFGLYRAWKDDGKITMDEVSELLGMTRDEFDAAVEAAQSKSDGAVPKEIEGDPTPVIDLRAPDHD